MVTVRRIGFGPYRAELAPTAIQSVAVLPLQNLSGDAAQEYFAAGITDEITNALARLRRPRVISRTSTMHYKGTHKTIPEIARDLKCQRDYRRFGRTGRTTGASPSAVG